jgi:beta-glucosidase
VTLEITPDRLAFWNIDRQRVVEPGEFAIMVGPNSVDLQTVTLTVR